MTQKYFDKFQTISYNGNLVKNITQRAVLLDSVYSDPNLYYPYQIREYERPDNIANRYYKDDYLSWILYLTNKVVDPYYDWCMDQTTFNDFVSKKYGSYVNSISKVKYYRNNWYLDRTVITTDQYSSLDSEQKQYYDKITMDNEIIVNSNEYVRKPIDWIIQTNGIAVYSVANGSSFISDEIVDVYLNNVKSGGGQIASSSNTNVTLKHLFNTISANITSTCYLSGRESGANTTFTTTPNVISNISDSVVSYWAPVTYYEYENEINEKNRNIRILDRNYSQAVSNQLEKLLK